MKKTTIKCQKKIGRTDSKGGRCSVPLEENKAIERARAKIAYFSMEIGLVNEIPTYSGGLGVLAGDTIKSSADLKLPLVAVTMLSKSGYFRQEITEEGKQMEHRVEWEPSKIMELLPTETKVQIQKREVSIKHGSTMCRV